MYFIISLPAITSELTQHLSNSLAKSGTITSVSKGTLQGICLMLYLIYLLSDTKCNVCYKILSELVVAAL